MESPTQFDLCVSANKNKSTNMNSKVIGQKNRPISYQPITQKFLVLLSIFLLFTAMKLV